MSQVWIPARFYRGGTSKGVFFHGRDLPADREACSQLLLAVLGSPDANGRQLDGMGGGISSLSKAVIIGPPSRADADVDYTFVQLAVDKPVADWTSNCGNLTSAVGPFAVDEGLVRARDGEALVRIHQTNTRKIDPLPFPGGGRQGAGRRRFRHRRRGGDGGAHPPRLPRSGRRRHGPAAADGQRGRPHRVCPMPARSTSRSSMRRPSLRT